MFFFYLFYSLTIVLIVFTLLTIKYLTQNRVHVPAYATLTTDGFMGTPISKLSQPASFYGINRQKTLRYLKGVYPTATDSFAMLSDLELASFFNSLWFYYHCQGEYTEKDLNLGSFTKYNNDLSWSALPCAKKYPMPYTPQGRLYNLYTYQKYNVPEVNSGSEPDKPYLQIERAGSTRPGIMGTYNDRNTRSSGIMWVMQRTIQRNVWYPNGLYNEKVLRDNEPDNWVTRVGNTPLFAFPDRWFGGLGNFQYIEVSHSPSYVGDALNMSPFWWYNVSVGSGLFLNLGKTLAVRNKVDGLFTQASLLAKSKEGKTLLMKWYNTTDPYAITWGIIGLCGFNAYTKQTFCYFPVQACNFACYPDLIGYAKAAGKQDLDFLFFTETLKHEKDPTKSYPSQETIKTVIDLAKSNKDYYLAHVSEQLLPDETNFFFGINLGFDTIQFYEDPNGNDNYVFEIIDLRIPSSALDQAKNRDYSGFMHIESPDAKVPIITNQTSLEWKDPYGYTEGAHKNYYLQTAISTYLENAYNQKWLSVRDPLDIYNEDKVFKCNGTILSKVCNRGTSNALNMYCSQVPLLDAYKCISPGNEFNNNTCTLTGPDPDC